MRRLGEATSMKFTHAPGRAVWNADRNSLHWVATVDGAPVLFGITRAALEKLMCSEKLSRDECLSAFELNRAAIERAAESVFARDPVKCVDAYLVHPDDFKR